MQEKVSRGRIVSDEDLQKALDWLRDSALDMGMAKERCIKAERHLQRVEAFKSKMSSATSAEARKADARTSDEWNEAATEEAVAFGEYEKLRALRDAAALKIETWRSEQANYRSMKI